MRLVALALAVACGGAQHRPPAPSMKELAAELDGELAGVARIIRDRRADCPRMASELRALYVRMERSFARAREAQADPARARELTQHMRAYDDIAAKRQAQIEADLTTDAACVRDPVVRDTLLAMPEL